METTIFPRAMEPTQLVRFEGQQNNFNVLASTIS